MHESSLSTMEIDTESGLKDSLSRQMHPFMLKLTKAFLRMEELDALLSQTYRIPGNACFLDKVLAALDIQYRISETDRSRIPSEGPVVVIANHPFGAVEGVVLGSVLRSVRSDTRMMANHLLKHFNVREFDELFTYVDPFGTADSVRANIGALREAIQWVRKGGMLGLFPAGEVSHLHLKSRRITDPKWNDILAGIVHKTRASVLPVFFSGSNSRLFQLLGLLHPRIRTLLLPREMLNKKHTTVHMRVGKLITFDRLRKFPDRGSQTDYLRLRTYMLANRQEAATNGRVFYSARLTDRVLQPISPPQPRNLVHEEIQTLPPDQVLVDTKKFQVLQAEAQQIPSVLLEVGRLRETTFRAAGEGTGKSSDLDRFDEHYIHLILWDKDSQGIAGGYRLGLTDRILDRYGQKGLYTSTLFEYETGFMERINPAVEVGRSFVRPEYQKTYQPLLLLWKGIGQFAIRYPSYKTFFGPVSVTNDYHSLSRQLIVAFSQENHHKADLARFVKGKHTFRDGAKRRSLLDACALIQDMQDLSDVISDIEKDQKGIPILLKHYMKLGGEVLGFSLDPLFSNVLDVLILVDLTRTNDRVLERYMGREGLDLFRSSHQCRDGMLECC